MTLLKNLKHTFDIFIYLCHFLARPTKGHILDAKRFKVNLRISQPHLTILQKELCAMPGMDA